MAAPRWPQLLRQPPLLLLLLLPALFCRAARGPRAVPTELAQDRVRCPGELWPLPQEGSNITFLYHPCVHPWLKLQFALLAHICVSQPRLIPYLGLPQQRPLVLVASGASLEMARVEPAWVARWLKRRRRRGKRRAWPTPSSAPWLHWAEPTLGKDRLCPRGSVQALATAFALRSWRPPGEGIKSWGPEYTLGGKRRGLRAAVGSLPTAPATRAPPHSLGISPGEAGDTPMLAIAPRGGESNDSRPGHGSPGGCVCPGHPSPAPRAAPSRPARAPTPRTEEAAWAATALTFLLVLLTLATLCTRLHRNFRRGESIYWGPSMDSQDTVAAVLKRRRLATGLRRPKRSRRRPLLPPGPDPVGGSLGPDGGGGDSDSSSD